MLVDKLDKLIKGYIFDEYLVSGFKYGFRLGYEGPRQFRTSDNLQAARDLPDIISKNLQKEVKLGRIKGPFKSLPFENLQISPIGCVPKKPTNEYRMIHHLSFPENHSINDFICDELSTAKYVSFDDAAKLLLSLGPFSLLAKTDIEAAFRIVPIHPLDHELLGIFWDGYYYDTCLPFGCSSSCAIFERFSSGIEWIAVQKLGIKFIIHILDDFLIMGPKNSPACQNDLNAFLDLCADLGVPIKESKTVFPTTVLTFLGLELDSESMEARLPLDKLTKLRELLDLTSRRRKITLKEIQSIIGYLQFCCAVVKPGRCFLRRLIDLTKSVSKPRHFITLNKEARKDIKAWQSFMDTFNGRSLLLEDRWLSSDSLHLYSDAAGSCGYAAMFKSHWFTGSWSKTHDKLHITFQELLPIVLAFEIWGSNLANQCILLHSDNMAVVYILNSQTSKDKDIMFLVRHFVLCCMRFNILTKAVHIPGRENILPDLLSRFQREKFHQLAPDMDNDPTIIPDQLRSEFDL